MTLYLRLATEADLERIMQEWDLVYGNLPYTLPLLDSTGLECWKCFYIDGYTPEHTFAEDQQAWV